MVPPWAYLDPQDRHTFQTTVAFLEKRLSEEGTIDWALKLNATQRTERLAINYILNWSSNPLSEPWATAWRLIEESWSNNIAAEEDGTAIYRVQKRLRAGERSGTIISAIVGLVAPQLKVEPIDPWRLQFIKKSRQPKVFHHLISTRLTSGDLIDLKVLDLAKLIDIDFLTSLANALEAAIARGLDIASRIGWAKDRSFLGLGMLNRVYYTQSGRRDGDDREPDAYHRGIAPAVKLLHAVVERIGDLEPESAQPFIQRWSLAVTPVDIRLWAAISRYDRFCSAEQVGGFLLALNDKKFWDLHAFPEVAELRAIRFGNLDHKTQKLIAARLQKGPPRSHWPKKAEEEKIKNARLYWAVRELQRVEVAGGKLPAKSKYWLDTQVVQFADLAEMAIDEGFPESAKLRAVPPNPDDRYNSLEGVARLRALETALSKSRGGWDNDPAARANDWLGQPEKAALIFGDFEMTGNGGNDFPRVWSRFGWAHSPKSVESAGATSFELQSEADRVLALLQQLSEKSITTAIEGICAWLDSWSKLVVTSPLGLPVWLQIWPTAVEDTNNKAEDAENGDLSVSANVVDDEQEPMDLDTLNTPAGKLIGVFLAYCPTVTADSQAFVVGSKERQMRDAVIAVNGRSGLIARHRLIEHLPYFLDADRGWAEENLIKPLLVDDGASLALWSAIARRTHFTDVLKIIGSAMAERATDLRLGRETRRRLVFSLVIESLHAFREERQPALPHSRIQQMLRTLNDEVRASAANAVQQFVKELSVKQSGSHDESSAADLFRSAAAPFLRDVWPQERSLATPGVSSAFADLPATSGDAFAEAVNLVERFLVPFECWSMLNYGLYGKKGEEKKLAAIDDETKAKEFLHLLDLTIGSHEGAVIPNDLTDALDQINSVAPSLAQTASYRRLATAARR